MKLYYNPVSSYSQKTLMALHEKGVTFEPSVVDLMSAEGRAAYKKVHPLGKVPFLDIPEKEWMVPESSIIIEYVDRHHAGGTKLIPDDPDLARQVRMRDRFYDLYVNNPMQKVFFDGFRPEGQRDPFGVKQAHETLDASLAMADEEMATRTWAMGDDFSMADCAAAPALAYTSKVHPGFDKHKNVVAYLGRLVERPSFARVLKDAEPHLAKMMGK
jgi:glutathione S-transferase